MPAFSDATTAQVNALRSGGFAGELRFAVCPNDIIFQATVNETITDSSFIAFDWDNTLQGDYEDVVAGMTFLITATDDPVELRKPLLRGRVSQALSPTLFFCGESGINLTDGMIVTVISNFEVVQVDRIGNLVDGFKVFEDLAPMVKNMKAFYYVEDTVEGTFAFNPIGQPMAEGATIASYHWTIPGFSYTTGDADTQNIEGTLPYGHVWAFLDITDTLGTDFRFIFEILVCDRDDPAYMYRAHDNVGINGGIDTGWNVSTSFFAGVENLLNRTRCAIVAFDLPKVGDPDLFDNVVFVGYIVEENTDITGDAISSTLSQTSFQLQSFAAIAGQLPVPSLPVRDEAVPSAWGDMVLPTPQRALGYIVTRYTTLANLCAIDVLFTDSTWFGGEINFEEGTLLDSINKLGQEINAKLVFFPQGDAAFEIDGDFLSDADRDALPTLLASGSLGTGDLFGYSLPVPYYKTVGQVIAGCATFYTDGSDPVKLKAIAPATARQEGNEKPVVLAQLLPADLTEPQAIAAAKQRIGNLLEFLNPPTNLPTTYKDGWRILTPSTRVWHSYDLPGTDSTRGLPIETSQRWLLQSVELTWNVDNGSWSVKGTPRLETRGGLAQLGATISPNTIDTSLPVNPGLDDYGAFAPDASLNYLSTDPIDEDLQPYTPNDLSQYQPMTTEDAANEADNNPGPNCTLLSPPVKFSSSVTRTTANLTVLNQLYTVNAKGMARIEIAGPGCEDLRVSPGVYTGNPDLGFAEWFEGSGLGGAPFVPPTGTSLFSWRYPNGVEAGPIARITFNFNQAIANFRVFANAQTYTHSPAVSSLTLDASNVPAMFPFDLVGGFAFTTVDNECPDSFRVKSICLYGSDDADVYGDAFYYGPLNGQWQLYGDGRGLLVNGTPVSVPPEYNQSHDYNFVVVGDGNQIPFTYYDTDYTDNQNLILYIRVCGPNMGT
jgi:hypothetical protein